MADVYLQFSELITDLSDAALAWLHEVLGTRFQPEGRALNPEIDMLDAHHLEMIPSERFWDLVRDEGGLGCSWEIDDARRQLWLYAFESSGNAEAPACLLQVLLQRFAPDRTLSITYARTCSTPRVGEFSGGAYWIRAGQIREFDTSTWVRQQNHTSP